MIHPVDGEFDEVAKLRMNIQYLRLKMKFGELEHHKESVRIGAIIDHMISRVELRITESGNQEVVDAAFVESLSSQKRSALERAGTLQKAKDQNRFEKLMEILGPFIADMFHLLETYSADHGMTEKEVGIGFFALIAQNLNMITIQE
jgi:hypothetical protein